MTDLTKTQEELITQAGEELLLIASGQSLETDDQQLIDSRVDGLFAELKARRVCDVTDPTAIPIEWCDALALLLANASSTAFGRQRMDDRTRDMIEDRLRVMVQNGQASNQYLQVDRTLKRPRYGYSLSRWSSGT